MTMLCFALLRVAFGRTWEKEGPTFYDDIKVNKKKIPIPLTETNTFFQVHTFDLIVI